MSSQKIYFTFILVVMWGACLVYAKDLTKSSLAFVIDDTASMYNEISQVKESVNAIFDTVMMSNQSQIDNFVLVTFNDRDEATGADKMKKDLLVITKDRDEFKRAIASVNVYGGDDCPEYSMSGIKVALENSLPLSLVYVFTDAAAKDRFMIDEIKNIAQRKQTQVTFLLTGKCGSREDADYQVYHTLAKATSGEVFNVLKDDIKDVLAYVMENIDSRPDVIVEHKFPPGKHEFDVPIDTKTADVIISSAGTKPTLEVVDPDGKRVVTKPVLVKKEATIVKVPVGKSGVYKAGISSSSPTRVKVTGKSTIHFEHGFSAFEPSALSDTATRPGADGDAHLSIQLHGDGVMLEVARIVDLGGNVLYELPLHLVDEETKFYITDMFDPPRTTFQLAVAGTDVESKTPLVRWAPTPITRQNPELDKPLESAPKTKIENGPKIVADYGALIRLKCKVLAYPKPDIIWEEIYSGVTLANDVMVIEEGNYISVLDVESTTYNSTYECKATNTVGHSSDTIEVEIISYFDVVDTPNPITEIQYDEEASIVCDVIANPPATMTWYKNGELITNDDNIEISRDNKSINIKHMNLMTQGNYMCDVRNSVKRHLCSTIAIVTDLEAPKIHKDTSEVHAEIGNDAVLTCRIIRGHPKPTIQWYHQRLGEDTFRELNDTSEMLYILNVNKNHAGTYKCIARNDIDTDRYVLDLLIDYAPVIRDKHINTVQAANGAKVTLSCDVDGVPTPVVNWYKDDAKLYSTKNIRITANNRIKFHPSITASDVGNYTCRAVNDVGFDEKTISVQIYEPPTIKIPDNSTIETTVGKSLILPCTADGSPRPQIHWIYNKIHGSKKQVIPSRLLRNGTFLSLNNLKLKHEGYYTCVATNRGGSSYITYEVKVNAPPKIIDVYENKTFSVVNGDLVKRIQCQATGNPTPTIVWQKDGVNIAIGSDWYDVVNGTLLIKNIDKKSEGTYECVAHNRAGEDKMEFNVNVYDYPVLDKTAPSMYEFIENGKSIDVKCDIPHKKTDFIRWYKDRKFLVKGELKLLNVSSRDAGAYSCRVSDFTESRSAHVDINVGHKPYFVSSESDHFDFEENSYNFLICEAKGYPEPQISWKFNNENINITKMHLELLMKLDNRGTYTCEVSNEFGSIQRSFRIVSKECILDLRKDYTNNQPVFLSRLFELFNAVNGFIVRDKTELLYLHCPTGFKNVSPQKIVTAFCYGDTKLIINGKVYDYTKIECNSQTQATTQLRGKRCAPGNTELIDIGYDLRPIKFLKVYEVCIDKDKNVPLYTQYQLPSAKYNASRSMGKWYGGDLFTLKFESIYNCNNQYDDISLALKRDFHDRDGCCFDKRQLVSAKDLRPGIPTAAAYNYLNVVPHWSTCSSKNWAEVEQRVRDLATAYEDGLAVTTGIAEPLSMRARKYWEVIQIHDDRGNAQHVPRYLWKVVQAAGRFLAIIQVNVPDLTAEDAAPYVLCPDICNVIEWMRGGNWRNVADGYTYCCEIRSFENAFKYVERFSRDGAGILSESYPEEYYSYTSI